MQLVKNIYFNFVAQEGVVRQNINLHVSIAIEQIVTCLFKCCSRCRLSRPLEV